MQWEQTHIHDICDKNAKMECMFGWNYVYFSISCRTFMFTKWALRTHAHTCVMQNMHSPVTWLCHLFVAMQLHFILLIILLNRCKCRETVFFYLSKLRDSCWCREQLPLLFQLKQRHRTCHGTYISHHFKIFMYSRIPALAYSEHNVERVECILMIRTK